MIKLSPGQVIYVVANALNVRQSPDAKSAKVGKVSRGEKLTVVDTTSYSKAPVGFQSWAKVAVTPVGGPSKPLGWIAAQYGKSTYVAIKAPSTSTATPAVDTALQPTPLQPEGGNTMTAVLLGLAVGGVVLFILRNR